MAAVAAPWRYGMAVATVGAAAWTVRRARRIGLWISDGRVIVRNFWRTFEFDLADVTGLGLALKVQGIIPLPAWDFRLRDGREIRAQATGGNERDQRWQWHALEALIPQPRNVPRLRLSSNPPSESIPEQSRSRCPVQSCLLRP